MGPPTAVASPSSLMRSILPHPSLTCSSSTGSVPSRAMEVIPSSSSSRITVKRVLRSLTFSSMLIRCTSFMGGRSSVKKAPSLIMDSSLKAISHTGTRSGSSRLRAVSILSLPVISHPSLLDGSDKSPALRPPCPVGHEKRLFCPSCS